MVLEESALSLWSCVGKLLTVDRRVRLCHRRFVTVTADLMVDNPFDSLSLGCDFARNFGCRHLDFACMHLWPDMWIPRCCHSVNSPDTRVRYSHLVLSCTPVLAMALSLWTVGVLEKLEFALV